MRRKILIFMLVFSMLSVVWPASAAAAAETLPEGIYTIQSEAGRYLIGAGDSLSTSTKAESNQWYLKKAANGAYYVYADNNKLLDLANDWDTEGNTVGIHDNTGYILAQTWQFVLNQDGSYRIRTVHDSGRVLTDNNDKQPTIQKYNDLSTQKWDLTRVDLDEPADYAGYKRIMKNANGYEPGEIIIHDASGQTDKSLRALIAANPRKQNMVEGKYVVLHFPNNVWAKYSNPKKLIDAFDFIYITQLNLIGGTAQIYQPKLVFLTDMNPNVPYMYMMGEYCAFSKAAASERSTINEWKKKKYPLWGVGHEIGHAMVNIGMGGLFDAYGGESWNNVLNVYAYDMYGLHDYARKLVAQYPRTYYAQNNKYGKYEGRDYDKLSDAQRSPAILEANQHIMVKLPMLLVDAYGWGGMQSFFTKAANDHASGMTASSNIQDRIDYMVVNLSRAYGMDLSALFDYWKITPSASAKAEISNLPKEQKIAASYGIK